MGFETTESPLPRVCGREKRKTYKLNSSNIFKMTDEEEPTLFEAIRMITHGIHDDIKEAQLLGREERVSELCDDYGQFMCDVNQEFLRRARATEELSSKYPECKSELSALAQSFRNSACQYSALYASLEKLQRAGKVPTSLPDILGL